MHQDTTILLTIAALSIAVPAAAANCAPNLERVADVDSGKDAHTTTGGHDCTEGPQGGVGCAVSDEVRGTSGGNRGGLRVYVDNDECQDVFRDDACVFSVWGYWETNGIDGLQRSDPGFGDDFVVGEDDTCGGLIPSDLNFF